MGSFIRINNRKNFLLGPIPSIHPASTKYLTWWRTEKKKIIEGMWSPDDANITNYNVHKNTYKVDSAQWRYMPGNLYFYINYGTILHNPEEAPKTAPKKKMSPWLRDVEWELFYNWLEARGFSGFREDDIFTSNRDVERYENGTELDELDLDVSCYNKKGKLKKFVPARSYLRQLHESPLGVPVYMNEARNLFMLGARGFGKSYSIADGMALHEILTDGAKEYTQDSIDNPATVEVFVGAALSSKSSDLLSKMKMCFNELPGGWKTGTDEEIPCPLYKDMAGGLEPNNMKSPWRHEYEKKVNGKWRIFGSLSNVKHGIYTTENPQAAAGTRPGVMIVEEVGLLSNLLTVHGSNTATQLEGTIKFGSTIYLGTGGNIEKIIESEIVFRDPEGYDFLSFEDEWEYKGKIGWFVPAYYALNQYKDKNGNTNVEKALSFLERRREKKRKAKSSSAITLELLSYPIKPSEMFLKRSGNFFPIDDLKSILADLESNDKLLNSSWKGKFIINKDGKTEFKNSLLPVIRSFPLKGDDIMEGSVEIFEMPKKNSKEEIAWGRYIAGTDPVDDDGNENLNLSLQSTLILDTFTDRIVAEYTSRTQIAEEYYETLRRLLMFYNARTNYEQNKKGLYGYFKNKKSLHLLAETPQILSDVDLTKINNVGNKKFGTNASDKINSWGRRLGLTWMLSDAYARDIGVMNMHGLRSVGFLKELIMWSEDINADRVSAMIMLMIYREEVIVNVDRQETPRETMATNEFWNNSYNHYYGKGRSRLAVGSDVQDNFLNW